MYNEKGEERRGEETSGEERRGEGEERERRGRGEGAERERRGSGEEERRTVAEKQKTGIKRQGSIERMYCTRCERNRGERRGR